MNIKNALLILVSLVSLAGFGIDHPGITGNNPQKDRLTLIAKETPAVKLVVDAAEDRAVWIAARNLAKDFGRVCGRDATLIKAGQKAKGLPVYIGTVDGPTLKSYIEDGGLDVSAIKGKREMYLIAVQDRRIFIAGSDRRGAVYGIYELSEQLGVSPWYDWADVTSVKRTSCAITRGNYTNTEPVVRYRGIFLNDEAPCLTGWVKNTYPDAPRGGHRFYARVGELLLRLRGNFLWPAMWQWAFYADDPENSKTLSEMGVIVGTSHHEPMARNHQEWARHRKDYGDWNYVTNQETLDRFFAEGIARMKGTEDIVTIGMRGDGDKGMEGGLQMDLMKKIISNQRDIIAKETGRLAEETPQMWALYKEVQDYYDQGLRVPDDVMILLCDDNWGNLRRLPDAEERKHKGGWGIYYHVDYVGAPRNSKWINGTSAIAMWEQMSLAYEYGADRLWILNVGDLKPMEYPIQLFLDMAWNPAAFTAENLIRHEESFCTQAFGKSVGKAAAKILDTDLHYANRITPEMLDSCTYNAASGEWKKVRDDYDKLAKASESLKAKLAPEAQDAYEELVGFHVAVMANLYDLYCAAATGDESGTAAAFAKDAELCRAYNEDLAKGKWRGMMTQKHIGYTSWNDNFPSNICPKVQKAPASVKTGCVLLEADACVSKTAGAGFRWVELPGLGRTKGALEVWPRTKAPEGAQLVYEVPAPEGVTEAKVTVNVRSTLAFARAEGHRYRMNGEEINFNSRLNEDKRNVYGFFYPTVAKRVVSVSRHVAVKDGKVTVTLEPLDPGVVFESVDVDFAGDCDNYLHGTRGGLMTAPEKRTGSVFGTSFPVGVAIDSNIYMEKKPEQVALVKKYFGSVTAENAMKPSEMQKKDGTFRWWSADKFVTFAEKNNLEPVGHVLIWHEQSPEWIYKDAVTLENYVRTVVGHFKGRVKCWDVVNEPFNEDGTLRDTPARRLLGDDYIAQVLRWVAESDPEAKLSVNDYNLWKPAKRDAMVSLVKRLKEQGVKVDVIGMQGHMRLTDPKIPQLDAAITAFASAGVKVAIAELDVSVLPNPWELTADISKVSEYRPELDPYRKDLPSEVEAELANRYAAIFEVFRKHAADMDRVTIWGLQDGQSWLNKFPIKGRRDYPLLFDRNLKPKAALERLLKQK